MSESTARRLHLAREKNNSERDRGEPAQDEEPLIRDFLPQANGDRDLENAGR